MSALKLARESQQQTGEGDDCCELRIRRPDIGFNIAFSFLYVLIGKIQA